MNAPSRNTIEYTHTVNTVYSTYAEFDFSNVYLGGSLVKYRGGGLLGEPGRGPSSVPPDTCQKAASAGAAQQVEGGV